MGNKLGMHIHALTSEVFAAVKLLKPRTVTIMDPTPQWIRDIRSVSPETFIVARKYEEGRDWRATDPWWWAEQCYNMVDGEHVDGFIAWNEPFGHDNRELFTDFDEWTYGFMVACRTMGKAEAVCLCFGTGNFTDAEDRVKVSDAFPLTCANAKYLGPHDYSWPDLLAGVGWYALRWLAWLEDIGRDDLEIIVTEAGLTQAVIAGRGDIGWRSGGPEGVSEDSYIAALDWYNKRLCKYQACLGCCLFDWAGSAYGWPTFEHIGIEQRIAAIDAPEPESGPEPEPEPEPEPNGGYEMEVKVFDLDYKQRDFQYAKTKYGVAYRRAEVEPGQPVYRLVELWEKTGNHSLITQALDQDGKGIEGMDIAFYWSGAPDPPDPPTTVYDHDWYGRFVHGLTNANGEVGPGMGTGAYHGEGEGGPHAVWIRDPDIPSDICEKLGMLAGTFHDHLDQKFRLMVEGEQSTLPTGDVLEVVKAIDEKLGRLVRHFLGEEEPEADKPFTGQYFNNETLSGEPALVREDEEINFEWGSDSPAPGIINADHFSVRWTGKRTFAAGSYRVHVRVDDGVRLWVDGALIIDAWKPQAPTHYEADVALTAGQHEIQMEYYEQAGGAVAQLWWEPL